MENVIQELSRGISNTQFYTIPWIKSRLNLCYCSLRTNLKKLFDSVVDHHEGLVYKVNDTVLNWYVGLFNNGYDDTLRVITVFY